MRVETMSMIQFSVGFNGLRKQYLTLKCKRRGLCLSFFNCLVKLSKPCVLQKAGRVTTTQTHLPSPLVT